MHHMIIKHSHWDAYMQVIPSQDIDWHEVPAPDLDVLVPDLSQDFFFEFLADKKALAVAKHDLKNKLYQHKLAKKLEQMAPRKTHAAALWQLLGAETDRRPILEAWQGCAEGSNARQGLDMLWKSLLGAVRDACD